MKTANESLSALLNSRQSAGSLRQLRQPTGLVDFCSNDYLGLARSPELREAIAASLGSFAGHPNGSTGSRLLAGNTTLAESLEAEIAAFHGAEAALLFNSGYDANIGLLASVPQRGDTLLTDELIHASMIDGARLSYATRHKFRHNDLDDLESKIRKATGTVYVAVESVYSMDGDLAPLADLCDLCDRYGAALLVDEAHATGPFGPRGEGVVSALGLENRVFARVHTFGKGLGVHGAVVLGSSLLRDFLINFARSFVYTTALPPHSLLAIRAAYEHLQTHTYKIHQLHTLRAFFVQQATGQMPEADWLLTESAIQGLVVPGNEACRAVAADLQASGLDVRPILSPTVPAGRERLRICLHTFNTEAEIFALVQQLKTTLSTVTHD